MFKRCLQPACGRPFQVNCFSAALTDVTPPGAILCPHCCSAMPAEPSLVFVTHALSPAEEAAFMAAESAENVSRR